MAAACRRSSVAEEAAARRAAFVRSTKRSVERAPSKEDPPHITGGYAGDAGGGLAPRRRISVGYSSASSTSSERWMSAKVTFVRKPASRWLKVSPQTLMGPNSGSRKVSTS